MVKLRILERRSKTKTGITALDFKRDNFGWLGQNLLGSVPWYGIDSCNEGGSRRAQGRSVFTCRSVYIIINLHIKIAREERLSCLCFEFAPDSL